MMAIMFHSGLIRAAIVLAKAYFVAIAVAGVEAVAAAITMAQDLSFGGAKRVLCSILQEGSVVI